MVLELEVHRYLGLQNYAVDFNLVISCKVMAVVNTIDEENTIRVTIRPLFIEI